MKDFFSTFHILDFPVSFRILGFGESLKSTIDKIGNLGYEGVSAAIASEDQLPTPTDEDKMVIILVYESIDMAISVAKSFYQAGSLTLIISTQPIDNNSKFCDAQTMVRSEDMLVPVKGILDILLGQGYINLDFNDVACVLRNSVFYKVVEVTGIGKEEERIADAISKIEGTISTEEMSSVKNILISIIYNRDIQPPVNVGEIKYLVDYISHLPEEVNAIWGIFHDEKMPTDEVRLSVIVSGKELKP